MPTRRTDSAGLVPGTVRGRGATRNPASRFDAIRTEAFDDGWGALDAPVAPIVTHVTDEHGASILTYNDSPDLGFDRSINPYRGCEHGCIYCYARPSHGYLGLSTGLDFETRLYAKVDAVRLLDGELRKKSYRPALVLIGANTDAYQPIERERQLTRQILQLLVAARHPFGIITKSTLVQRDLDVLSEGARLRLCHAYVSVTTLDRQIARRMEPRAPTPERRLETIRALASVGVPTGVMVAPLVPGLTDHELEAILQAAAAAGAKHAGYVLLRLPHEIKELFLAWLAEHFPGRVDHVQKLLRAMRAGLDNDSHFGTRMIGTGTYAELLRQRFDGATRRLGLDERLSSVDVSQFRMPAPARGQLELF
ncbi:MAG: PA0069 family radical SAM protein [Myxococcales bacterium]|nr:PA0069 family radical SAM protein [Myxococcales bacterium]